MAIGGTQYCNYGIEFRGENGKEVWEDVYFEELKRLASYVSLFVLTAQSHLLRKVVDPTTGRLYLGLFLYLAENTQVIENSNYIIMHFNLLS